MARPVGTAGQRNRNPTFGFGSQPVGSGGENLYIPMANNAASKYGVPLPILMGVFGMETDFGRMVSTSSAGAVGLMQFIPSTAASYGYPLTNTPTQAQAQQQFDAAAHLLSDLYHQHGGNWNAALQAYSGGGYGLAQVQAKSKARFPGSQTDPTNAGIFGTGIGSNPGDPSVPNVLQGIFNQIVNDAKYGVVLVAALAAGVYLFVHGLTGATKPNEQGRIVVQMARGVARR